ncbi:MAG: menaquinone biosynthesis protein [Bacteroidota bacterium]|nr:menaquinone biosynthesis protein [Bacteroidota bacterium]
MFQKRYKISIVNYLNTLPFVYGLKESGIDKHIDISYDIPAVCAEKLLTNQVDIGLVPVAILSKMPEYHILTDFCIGSNGVVDSVKLFSSVPLNEIKEILLDYQSRTSVTLVQILAKELWKITPVFLPAMEGFESKIDGSTAAVIIGDRTFAINNTFSFEYDLATEWKKLTGLPFAFATWTSSTLIKDEVFLKEFNSALAFGINHTKEALSNYSNNIKGFDAFDYLSEKISHSLDQPKREAIKKFLAYVS